MRCSAVCRVSPLIRGGTHGGGGEGVGAQPTVTLPAECQAYNPFACTVRGNSAWLTRRCRYRVDLRKFFRAFLGWCAL